MGKELSLRQAAQDARRQIKTLEINSKFHQEYRQPQSTKMNGQGKTKTTSPAQQEAPWKYAFKSIKSKFLGFNLNEKLFERF